MTTSRQKAMTFARKIEPLIRIGLYTLAGGVLVDLPPGAARILTTDPAMAELAIQGVGMLIFAGSMLWWRLAKRFGRET